MEDGEPIALGISLITGEWFVLGPDGWRYTREEYAQITEDQAIDRAHDLLGG